MRYPEAANGARPHRGLAFDDGAAQEAGGPPTWDCWDYGPEHHDHEMPSRAVIWTAGVVAALVVACYVLWRGLW